jgi:hypothetical protein
VGSHILYRGRAFPKGYDVTFTMGNTPRIDLLCPVPDGREFKVQVKGISTENASYVQKRFFEDPTQQYLYLVVVLVPHNDKQPLMFFILTHKEAQEEFKKMPKKKKGGRIYPDAEAGLNWGSVAGYEHKWASFPQRCG